MAETAPADAVATDNAAPPAQNVDRLPNYARSLLKVTVPVSVTLASKRQSVGDVVELVPGSLITFDKPCRELLELAVNQRPLARGEAVKVGETFGLRIAEMILPHERFAAVLGKSADPVAQSA